MTDDAFPAEWMEKHCHVLTSRLSKTRGSALEKEREPIAEARCGSIFIYFFLSKWFYSIAAVRTNHRNKWWFSFVYSLHGPNVCTSLIGTINRDKAEASWWAVGVGLMPHRSTWKLKVGGVQGNAVAKRASCLYSYQRFFFPPPCWCFHNDSAHRRGPSKLGGLGTPEIWTGLCSSCSSHPEIWSSTQKHWCALIVYGHFRFFQALKCTCDVDSVVFLCDTNYVFSGFLTSFHNPLMIRHMTDAFREQYWKWGMRINVV